MAEDSKGIPPIAWRSLGLRDYETVWQAMQRLTRERDGGTPDEIWTLQHPPVFTLGQAGRPEHLLDPGAIPVVRSDRGGQVTYHGPGQLVAYVLYDLRRAGVGVRTLVERLEHPWVRQTRGARRVCGGAQDRLARPAGPARLQLSRTQPQRRHGPTAILAHQPLRISRSRGDSGRGSGAESPCLGRAGAAPRGTLAPAARTRPAQSRGMPGAGPIQTRQRAANIRGT